VAHTAEQPRVGTEVRVVDGGETRIGRDPRKMTTDELQAIGHERLSPMAAIRAHCLDCCGGSPNEVRYCMTLRCPSWPYRMGANPWRALVSEERREAARTHFAKIKSGALGPDKIRAPEDGSDFRLQDQPEAA
jgi:hypothetical protein